MADNTVQKEGSTMMWWVIFVVTTIITSLMVVYVDEWFWVVLPFSLTSLCKALRVI